MDTPGALAATVATNEQAQAINAAVRDIRIRAGTVDDSQVTTGMDQVRIGVGDHIVTRSNDAANDVSNRQSWTVAAINTDGSLLARSLLADPGQRQVLLDSAYVARAVQLGYATTDYGNQGTTTDKSLTWVADATTAAGLYVGATRGRYANTLHIVATDLDQASDHIVAAMGRDRTDRGLDVARDQAQTESAPTPQRSRTHQDRPPQIDLSRWRTEAELEADTTKVQAQIEARLRQLQDVAVLSEEDHLRQTDPDREAASVERERARHHQYQASRLAEDAAELATTAQADFLEARDAARIIDAGPGLLRHRGGQVEAARTRLYEIAQRWPTDQLPDPGWSDQAVAHFATKLINDTADPQVHYHQDQAAESEEASAAYRRQVDIASKAHEQALRANRNNAIERAGLLDLVQRQRAILAALHQYRQDHVATMAPEQVAAVDQARNRAKDREHMARLIRNSEQRLAASQEPYRSPSRSGPSHPGRHREGPGLGM